MYSISPISLLSLWDTAIYTFCIFTWFYQTDWFHTLFTLIFINQSSPLCLITVLVNIYWVTLKCKYLYKLDNSIRRSFVRYLIFFGKYNRYCVTQPRMIWIFSQGITFHWISFNYLTFFENYFLEKNFSW